jgi:processive 1,2-diacylglycerol beta-glucosyltransferase
MRGEIVPKKLLIISSDFTGHGHKSITEAVKEKLELDDKISIHVVDGFSLGGISLSKIGKLYGPITRHSEFLWKAIFDFSAQKPSFINSLIRMKIENNFVKLLDEIKPDVILTVHPNFNGSILDILDKHGYKIPFITLIADLVSISPLWADPRADYIISPTKEAKEICIQYGVPEYNIKITGFPVRSRFYKDSENPSSLSNEDSSRPLECLLMGGGEGAGNMEKIAQTLLQNFDCHIKIVAGRNVTLKEKLEQSLLKEYSNRVTIFGFTDAIQELMFSSDIAFTRGSPNVMMESVASNIPLIITGALPGQEEGNPSFAEKHNLGVVCKNPVELKETINLLLQNDSTLLKEIKNAQKMFQDPSVVDMIVSILLDVFENEKEMAI